MKTDIHRHIHQRLLTGRVESLFSLPLSSLTCCLTKIPSKIQRGGVNNIADNQEF